MEFNFQMDSPLYLQMADELERCIVSGELRPEQKLPSVRELAAFSKTNPNTVQKALSVLEEKHLIETRRTAGKFVRADLKDQNAMRREMAMEQINQCVEALRKLGCSREEMDELWKEVFSHGAEG